MDKVIADIFNALRQGRVDAKELDRLIRAESKRLGDGRRRIAKKHILPYFLKARQERTCAWESWNTTPELEDRFIRILQVKPRRTASGVATITVITKPWPCHGTCLFCPNDIRMPKSYLHNEPACQRAERNCFDPYLQTASRLEALKAMGHSTQKVELIVLGGSWTDYPAAYRLWFAEQLFACLNASDDERSRICKERRELYRSLGIHDDPDLLARRNRKLQDSINAGTLTYNQAFPFAYGPDTPWEKAATFQQSCWDALEDRQIANEKAQHRVVGLVVETRPDGIDASQLTDLRRLGCTKVQLGIQSLDAGQLSCNGRPTDADSIAQALELCRLFGFKTHGHFMVNLMGATPQSDKAGYRQLVGDGRYMPDEVKLYPCVLVDGTPLMDLHRQGRWLPYEEADLVDVLQDALQATPPFIRISRMIRDISSEDIVAGNKKTNLRQLVESGLQDRALSVQEIRFREVGTAPVKIADLTLNTISYQTPATAEHFLSWITPQGKIAGFLRLSLPGARAWERWEGQLPIQPHQAMIREVHIYGFATELDREGDSAQHHGLGRMLVERACSIAEEAGYTAINVISAVGTREYYRKLGFKDAGLYQRKDLKGNS